MFQKDQLTLLKQFVSICKSNPAILHTDELKFFKDWLESLNADLPPAPEKKPEPKSNEAPSPEPTEMKTDPPEENEEKEDEDVYSEESDVELEELDNLIKDEVDIELEMGDKDKEPTEEEEDQASEKRGDAISEMNSGNLEEALKLFTEAIKLNPSASLYSKRAALLIKMKKPSAAIRDCEQAMEINNNNALAYKWRGRARRLLGQYEEAWHDFQHSCKLDFDDTVYEWQKEVEPNGKKIHTHRLKWDHKKKERDIEQKKKEIKRRRAEAQKAYEKEQAEKEAAGGGFPGGMGGFPGGMPGGFPGGMPGGFPGGMPGGFPGGMPGGMPGGFPGGMSGGMPGGMPGGAGGIPPGMDELFKDPELMAAMQDAEVMAAFQDVSKNPANMSKYENNPKVKSVLEKLKSKFGGM